MIDVMCDTYTINIDDKLNAYIHETKGLDRTGVNQRDKTTIVVNISYSRYKRTICLQYIYKENWMGDGFSMARTLKEKEFSAMAQAYFNPL